jgi:hypothetical protein
MNIHLPAILMFTRGTRFWHTAIWHHKIPQKPPIPLAHWHLLQHPHFPFSSPVAVVLPTMLPAGWAMTRGSGKVLNTDQPDRTLINHESTGKNWWFGTPLGSKSNSRCLKQPSFWQLFPPPKWRYN